MAFKKQSTPSATARAKQYFWCAADYGNGQKKFHYVSADAPTTIEVSGYFDDTELETLCKPGDLIMAFQVAAISDDRSIQDDLAAGLVDISLHAVVQSDGSGLNVTPDLMSATITYTS